MEKINFRKQLKSLYLASAKHISIVDIPRMNFFMVDGKGDPNTSKAYGQAVEALFSLSYTLKFMVKRGPLQIDYGVLPLESLWWADVPGAFEKGQKELWQWTAMIMQPEFISPPMFREAKAAVAGKKALPALPRVRFEAFEEGTAAQVLHIGPFSEEGPVIRRLHNFIEENGGSLRGKHHEIYLSDIRRAAPEKWKTIIRQPFN